jgi:outer membrane protein
VKMRILGLFATGLFVTTLSLAQAPPTKVGVIEGQTAIGSTKEGQKAVAELNLRMEAKKKDLDRQAGEIRDLQDKLQKGGNAMSQTAKDDLTRTIEKKTTSYKRDVQDAQEEAQLEERKMVEELSQKLSPVIDRFAQANGYSLIIDVSNPSTPVMFASASINITKDIVELYDKTAAAPRPSVGATPPAKPAPAAPPVKKQ